MDPDLSQSAFGQLLGEFVVEAGDVEISRFDDRDGDAGEFEGAGEVFDQFSEAVIPAVVEEETGGADVDGADCG